MSEWQPTALEQQRLDKLDQLRALGIDPYPLQAQRTHSTADARQEFERQEAAEEGGEIPVIVCGRLIGVRRPSLRPFLW